MKNKLRTVIFVGCDVSFIRHLQLNGRQMQPSGNSTIFAVDYLRAEIFHAPFDSLSPVWRKTVFEMSANRLARIRKAVDFDVIHNFSRVFSDRPARAEEVSY